MSSKILTIRQIEARCLRRRPNGTALIDIQHPNWHQQLTLALQCQCANANDIRETVFFDAGEHDGCHMIPHDHCMKCGKPTIPPY